jgi:hypothetical protein
VADCAIGSVEDGGTSIVDMDRCGFG